MMNIAVRTAEDEIRFVRDIAAPPARVWALLTTPEGLAEWLGPAKVDPRVGGEFTVQLNEDVLMTGKILTLEAPHRLVVAWKEIEDGKVLFDHAATGDGVSELSFTVVPHASGTQLTLLHRLIPSGDMMRNFGAGWHSYLDMLQAITSNAPAGDVMQRYHQLRPEYETRLSTVDREPTPAA